MNHIEGLKALDGSLHNLKAYRQSFVDTPSFDSHRNALLTESVSKLEKLSFILKKCYETDAAVHQLPTLIFQEIMSGKSSNKYDQMFADKLLELGVYSEAFYYTAFRVYKIHEELGIKFKCVGVRDVRNHLIEHPEVLSQSIGTGNSGNGPVLKNGRQQGAMPKKKDEMDVFQDKGLFVNFKDFIESFDRRLLSVSTTVS
jgi:hypothetical protein